MAEPTVKRYKASYAGYYAGTYYETSVVTYNKTRKETIDLLKENASSDLYVGVYKGGTGRKARLNITSPQRVEQEFIETRREIRPQSGYLRYKGTPKEHYVRGSIRTYIYGYYVIPEDEIEQIVEEDLGDLRRRS